MGVPCLLMEVYYEHYKKRYWEKESKSLTHLIRSLR